MSARKGLKRLGFRFYVIEGPLGKSFIYRDVHNGRTRVFQVSTAQVPHPFFTDEFKRLAPAREAAEKWAGLK